MSVKQAIFRHKTVKELPKCKRGDVLYALEELVGPQVQTRTHGLEQLLALDAHRRSPVVAAILANRVGEPDIDLRLEIVKALAMVLRPDLDGTRALDSVRCWLRYTLGRMRRRETYALLQIIVISPENLDPVCQVLDACSFSGVALVQILADRNVDVAIRIAAAKAIGRIGFLEAEPVLQRLGQRLARRKAGQMEMAFAPIPNHEAQALLPEVINALHALEDGTD